MSVFLDTNVPIYAAGSPHPLKAPCSEIILLIADNPGFFVTDAEVLQEILHRYMAIRRWTEGKQILIEFMEVMQGAIVPMLAEDVRVAVEMADSIANADARDLIHLAVMQRMGVTQIITADRGFDSVPGIERLDPARLSEWRESALA